MSSALPESEGAVSSAPQPHPIPIMSAAEFEQAVSENGDFLAQSPCIITDFIQRWPAYGYWKDIDYLAKRFGHLPVNAGAPQFATHKNTRTCRVDTNFANYIEYVKAPRRARELFDGRWMEGSIDQFEAMNMPLYCGNIQIVRHSGSPVLDEFQPLLPAPLVYWNDLIPYYYQLGNHFWLYVSLAGAVTPLHQDNNAVIAYLAQLKGTKRALLYSPEDSRHYYREGVGYLDPTAPDPEDFPTWTMARPWAGTLREGQMLLFGSNWAHYVVTEDDSVSVSFDFVNASNLRDYACSRDWLHTLGSLVKRHPDFFRQRVPETVLDKPLAEQTEWIVGKQVAEHLLKVAVSREDDAQVRRIKTRLLRHLEASV